MALSVYANYTGTTGSRYRLWLDISTVSQNYGTNQSVVRVTCRMDTTNNYGWFDFTNQTGNIVIHGTQYNFNSNYPSSGVQTFITQDHTVTHNADGNLTIYVSGYHNANQGSGLGTSNVGTNYTLARIPKAPTISTTTASGITTSTANTGGNVTDSGGATITQRGIYYSTSDSTPDSNDLVKTVSGTTGSFSTTLTSLSPGTLYYYRAYAINSQGTGYGAVKTLTTNITPYASMIYNSSNVYADGKLIRDTGSGWADVTGDLYFETYSAEGATTVPQLSLDPSTIIENVLDYFNDQGGVVTYTGASIDNTGTTTSYTFVSQSCFEAINKCLELAPYEWYWYVDPATNLLHFHEKSASADHKFIMGKDIEVADVEKRGEDVVNTIFFTGGDQGGGAILYKKYVNAYSVGLYGQRAIKYIDQRVTDEATAQLIANNILGRHALPEVRLKLTIADSNGSEGGYDIESVKVGDIINVQNVRNSVGSSLWDEARFDVDRYDFNITKITTMYLQVTRIEYNPNALTVSCSTIPPEITKRIEDLKRNLDATVTINNPDTPS